MLLSDDIKSILLPVGNSLEKVNYVFLYVDRTTPSMLIWPYMVLALNPAVDPDSGNVDIYLQFTGLFRGPEDIEEHGDWFDVHNIVLHILPDGGQERTINIGEKSVKFSIGEIGHQKQIVASLQVPQQDEEGVCWFTASIEPGFAVQPIKTPYRLNSTPQKSVVDIYPSVKGSGVDINMDMIRSAGYTEATEGSIYLRMLPDGGEQRDFFGIILTGAILSPGIAAPFYTGFLPEGTGLMWFDQATLTPDNFTIRDYPKVRYKIPYESYLCFETTDVQTIAFERVGDSEYLPYPTLLYSIGNTASWQIWDYSPLSFDRTHKVYIRGINNHAFALDGNIHYQFVFSTNAPVTVSGECNALLDHRKMFASFDHGVAASAFRRLFKDCTALVSASGLRLSAMSLSSYEYEGMFMGCTSLVDAPELPATTLGGLCYESMFEDCMSLVNAPDLPAMELAQGCYFDMFRGCKALVNAPDLPAPILTPTCYAFMFLGCDLLEKVKCLATDLSAQNATVDWLSYVASSGTFTKKAGITWPTGEGGIPSGWDVVEE